MADKNYNEAGFFQKLNIFARIAGHTLVEKALQLYYAAESKDTPKWAKGVVMGALAYFVSPIDAIPDVIPGIGFTDDLGVLIGAVATIAAHITPKQKAVSITHKAPGVSHCPGDFFYGRNHYA